MQSCDTKIIKIPVCRDIYSYICREVRQVPDSVLGNHFKNKIMSAKKTVSVAYMLMGIAFCVALITSNLLETKVFRLFGPFNMTCGFLVFPISYILNDCIVEVWGYSKARLVIWTAFVMEFFLTAFAGLSCILPPVEPGADAAFKEIFSFAPQIVVASLLAFLVGSFLNAKVMSRMRISSLGKGQWNLRFAFRAILSSIVGETADSIIFFPLAFYLYPLIVYGEPKVSVPVLLSLMLTQVIGKTAYEVVILPLTTVAVKKLSKAEGAEPVD